MEQTLQQLEAKCDFLLKIQLMLEKACGEDHIIRDYEINPIYNLVVTKEMEFWDEIQKRKKLASDKPSL